MLAFFLIFCYRRFQLFDQLFLRERSSDIVCELPKQCPVIFKFIKHLLVQLTVRLHALTSINWIDRQKITQLKPYPIRIAITFRIRLCFGKRQGIQDWGKFDNGWIPSMYLPRLDLEIKVEQIGRASCRETVESAAILGSCYDGARC